MADDVQGDSLIYTHHTSAGRLGGSARTPEKLAAVRVNVAKARAAKDYYRRHPEEHPAAKAAAQQGDAAQELEAVTDGTV